MTEFILIKIEDTGIIPIINEENPEYALVTPRVYNALVKANVNVIKITENELEETITIPEFSMIQKEVVQKIQKTARPTSRRRPAILLKDVIVKGERVITVEKEEEDFIIEIPDTLEVQKEVSPEEQAALDLMAQIKTKRDVERLNKNQCKVILDHLGERCVYRDSLDVRHDAVKEALFSKK